MENVPIDVWKMHLLPLLGAVDFTCFTATCKTYHAFGMHKWVAYYKNILENPGMHEWDKFYEDRQYWSETQTCVLLKLIHLVPGAQIHQTTSYGYYGAYLNVETSLYSIDIEFEDVRNMKDYREFECVTIIVSPLTESQYYQEKGIWEGTVRYMEEANDIAEQIRRGFNIEDLYTLYEKDPDNYMVLRN